VKVLIVIVGMLMEIYDLQYGVAIGAFPKRQRRTLSWLQNSMRFAATAVMNVNERIADDDFILCEDEQLIENDGAI
jgi:hypothetical protein